MFSIYSIIVKLVTYMYSKSLTLLPFFVVYLIFAMPHTLDAVSLNVVQSLDLFL